MTSMNLLMAIDQSVYSGLDRPFNIPSFSHDALDNIIKGLKSTGKRTKIEGNFSNLDQANLTFAQVMSPVSMHFSEDYRSGLLRQMGVLLSEDNWDHRDVTPSEGTMKTFLRLLLMVRGSRRPGVGSDGMGSITAMWTVDDNRLTIECYSKDKLKWLLFRNGERASGETSVSRINDVLSPYDPSVWFNNA